MKRQLALAVLTICSLFAVATEVKPIWDMKLNEGDFASIMSTGTRSFKAMAKVTEKLEWGPGRLGGKALYFNNDINCKERPMATVMVPTAEHFDFSKPFTVMCWFKCSEKLRGNMQYTIFGNTPTDYGPGIRLVYSWGALRLNLGQGTSKTSGSMSVSQSKVKVALGCWNHVAVSYDGKTVRIFYNGIEAAAAERPVYPTKPRMFSIGTYNGNAYCFSGAISDFKLYDKALSPEAVLKLAKDIR